MNYDNLTTEEKLNEALAALESISEEELSPDDEGRFMEIFMGLQNISKNYGDQDV